jgi:hypothetical protein
MEPPQLKDLLTRDPYLSPYEKHISARYAAFCFVFHRTDMLIYFSYNYYMGWMSRIKESEGGLEQFSRGYERFGFNESDDGTITFAEWCPGALSVSLVGDFSMPKTIAALG